MNAKPVKGSSDDHSRKKEDKSTPPPEAFREQLKVTEIDPEAKGKWKNKQYQALEASSESQEAVPPPPSQIMSSAAPQTYEGSQVSSTQPTTQTSQAVPYVQSQQQTEPLPTSYNFWRQESDLPPPTQTSEQDSSSDQERPKDQHKEALTTKEKEETAPSTLKGPVKSDAQVKTSYTKAKNKAFTPKKTQQQIEQEDKIEIEAAPIDIQQIGDTSPTPLPKGKIKQQKIQTTSQAEEAQTETDGKPIISKRVEKPLDANVAYQDVAKESSKKDKSKKAPTQVDTTVASAPAHSMSLTPEIQAQAFQGVQSVSSYINPKVESLFHNMVGAIIQTTKKGIAKTEILLSQPNMKTSQFYGSKITLTRYSTDPYSYNITLSTTNPKALTQFNNHLDSLKTAFVQGNFDFKVGRLEAHYVSDKKEGYLFRRKEESGQKDMGSQKEEK